MPQLPEILLQSLEGVEGFNRETFEAVHAQEEKITSVRVNPFKLSMVDPQPSTVNSLEIHDAIRNELGLFSGVEYQPVPWSRYGYYLESRPSFTFDPLFHAGCYYVQEASSMFLEQALTQLLDLSQPLKVLDVSAAPGGKSTHILSLISKDSLLVSNEVIKSRAHILTDNIIKWGAANVVVTNNDPSAFQRLEGFFDVMVVDAPCSGSGLFRRDAAAIEEWSPNAVQLCSQRQQRILADALPALREGGLLVYSTCSYSKEEDEEIGDWLVRDCGMENLALQMDERWKIITTHSEGTRSAGYRFYPDKLKGEGFFLACYRKLVGGDGGKYKTGKPEKATAREGAVVKPWVEDGGFDLLKQKATVYALPQTLTGSLGVLQAALYIQYAGVRLGEVIREKFVPDHALAVSSLIASTVPSLELDYENAVRYLQRAEMNVESPATGWQTVSYKNYRLGWINALKNRVNNYYPKENRILKQQNDAGF